MPAQAKKRRRGQKVTRKQPKNLRLRIHNKIRHVDIKKLFDKNKSPAENMRELGLEDDANRAVKRRKTVIAPGEEKKESPAFVGMASLAQRDHMSGPNFQEANSRRRKMSEFDQTYVKANVLKHKDDYKAMELDTKTNYFQHGAGKMRKLCETYLALDASERLVSSH